MSQNAAKKQEIDIQISDITEESNDSVVAVQEPTLEVRASRRKSHMVAVEENNEETRQETPEKETESQRADGPPPFIGILQLEPKNLKDLQKALKTFKHSTNMKKLSCLDYFSSFFSEMAYFEVNADTAALEGSVGFGNLKLTSEIRNKILTEDQLPSLFEILANKNTPFFGAVASLREEDAVGLTHMGFQAKEEVLCVPVVYKKAVTGLWICTSALQSTFTDKELASLKKVFIDFIY